MGQGSEATEAKSGASGAAAWVALLTVGAALLLLWRQGAFAWWWDWSTASPYGAGLGEIGVFLFGIGVVAFVAVVGLGVLTATYGGLIRLGGSFRRGWRTGWSESR